MIPKPSHSTTNDRTLDGSGRCRATGSAPQVGSRSSWLACLFALVLVAGCTPGSEETSGKSSADPVPAADTREVAADAGSAGHDETGEGTLSEAADGAGSGQDAPVAAGGDGVIAGRIVFEGQAPGARRIAMGADPFCAGAHKDGASARPLLVSEDGGLGEVVVHVTSPVQSGEAPTEPVMLDQKGCMYSPRVVALRAGQPLLIRNSDRTLHNVHSMPTKSSGFNLGMPMQGMKTTERFSEPEVFVRFKCDVHPWMSAHVAVLDTPHFAVSAQDGSFRIDGLAPGTYTLEAAHPRLGRQSAEVEVGSGGEASLNFTFRKPG